METARLSSKGQVVIPKAIRKSHSWKKGTEFVVESLPGGVVFKPKSPFPPTTIDDLAGCLKHKGPPVSVREMDEAIAIGVKEKFGDRR